MWNVLFGFITLGMLIILFFTHDEHIRLVLVILTPVSVILLLVITEIRYARFMKLLRRLAEEEDAKKDNA